MQLWENVWEGAGVIVCTADLLVLWWKEFKGFFKLL